MADGINLTPVDPSAVDALVDGFPARLHRCRERSNLTVPQASTRARLDPGQWRKFERGDTEPGMRILLRMQYALRLETLEPLFDDTSLATLSK